MSCDETGTRLAAARAGQEGSALIVTLVLLLVLTVIGVAGMGSSILQERMAGNTQDSAQVFEATESALRLCEAQVENGVTVLGEADVAEFDSFREGGGTLEPARAEMIQPSLEGGLTAKGSTQYQLRCLVEYTGQVDPAAMGCSLGRGRRGLPCPQFEGYRITAAGARASADETDTLRPTVLLQSDMVMHSD